MNQTLLSLTGALALLGTTPTLRAEVTFNNLDESVNFRGFSSGISAGTVFATGSTRYQVDAVTLEHYLYDPANPPQGFQVRIYRADYPAGSSDPNMTLVAELGNPTAAATFTALPGYSTYVAYFPSIPITLEAATTYAVTVGGALGSTGNGIVGFTDSTTYSSSAGWLLGGSVLGLDLGGFQVWSPFTSQLKFRLDASPSLNQPPDISQARASVCVLRGSDGRMIPFHIEGVTDPDGDPVTISITCIQQDEPLGNGVADAIVNGSDTAAVRATRLGKGNGRVYKVFFTASDGKPGGLVNGNVYIAVPHDQSGSNAIDDGPVTGYYKSTVP